MAQFIRQTFFAGAADGGLEVSYQSTGPLGEVDSKVDSTTELEFALGTGAYTIQIERYGTVFYETDTSFKDGVTLKIIASGDLQIAQLDCALHEIGIYCARDAAKNRIARLKHSLEEAEQKFETLNNLY